MIGLEFPNISPIIFSIGPVVIRWYSMAYLAGLVAAWVLALHNIKKYNLSISKQNIEDAVFYSTIGIILGGRLGYVLFYGGNSFWQNPLQIFAIWEGGMSFHGGAIGAVLGMLYTAKKAKIRFLQLTDLAALYAPIGIFLGRMANFVNDELWGRITDVAWAVKFPSGGYLPRHPSQIYEGLAEGLLMFIILNLLWRSAKVRKSSGFSSALFVLFYAIFRIILENFRQPDAQLGFLWGGYFTMGQILSLPLIVLGIYLLYYSLKPEK